MSLNITLARDPQGDLFYPEYIDLTERLDKKNGVRYLGQARRIADDRYEVLADVNGRLCMVEVKITILEKQ